jgi:subtilase family serine protease
MSHFEDSRPTRRYCTFEVRQLVSLRPPMIKSKVEVQMAKLLSLAAFVLLTVASGEDLALRDVGLHDARPQELTLRARFLYARSTVGLSPLVRVSGPVDPTRGVMLKGNVHRQANSLNDLGPVDPGLNLRLTLYLKRSGAQQVALERLLKNQEDPSSPQFHRWLTPEEYGRHFGVTETDGDAVLSWIKTGGFTITSIARGRDFIGFNGTAGQVQTALNTSIHSYDVKDGTSHYANASEPWVPAALAGIIRGFEGLDDFHRSPSKPVRRRNPSPPGYPLTLTTGRLVTNALVPDDVSMIYDIDALHQMGLDGTGQKLVVVGQSKVDLADIHTFRQTFNLPPNDPEIVLVPGSDDPDIGPGAQEAALGVEWIGAIAPHASIILVYEKSALGAAQYAVDNNLAPVIAFSFSSCETDDSLGADFYRDLAQKANVEGITWIAPSGDVGAAGCEQGDGTSQNLTATTGLSVSLPASLPEVTGVGGTEFAETQSSYLSGASRRKFGSPFSNIPEVSWNDSSAANGFAASGGGGSAYFGKPAWQAGVGVKNDGVRDVPDLALTASFTHHPYWIFFGGAPETIGGTAAATSVFSGIIVLLNQYLSGAGQESSGLGNINGPLYRLSQNGVAVYRDVAAGNNIIPCLVGSTDCLTGAFGYIAGLGYDQITGLGSVDAYALVTGWTSALTMPMLATTSLTSDTRVQVEGQITVSVTVANKGLADARGFRIGYYLTSVTQPTQFVLLAVCDYPSLVAGASQTCSGVATFPAELQLGNYYLMALADDLDQVVQSDNSQAGRVSDSGTVTLVASPVQE